MRRYKEGVYAIPYEGEEVKLHWANADQYYVKTAEYFRDYSLQLPSGRLAHFKIVEAETEKDNVKAASGEGDGALSWRRFLPRSTRSNHRREEPVLAFRFEYRPDPEKRDQKALNGLAAGGDPGGGAGGVAGRFAKACPNRGRPERTLLEKRLTDYTARNTFDYFIHKDLRGFLRRELDFYIKNEVMRLDDIEDEDCAARRAVPEQDQSPAPDRPQDHRFPGADRGFPEEAVAEEKVRGRDELLHHPGPCAGRALPRNCANDAQREEWVRLFAIDEIQGRFAQSRLHPYH